MARIYFAIIALTMLGLSIYIAISENNLEWKWYQKEYYAKLAELESDEYRAQQIRATTPVINQIYNTEYGIVDRCTTCHVSYSNTQFKEEIQPFRTHPGSMLASHPVETFGCAICHDGNPYGTSVEGGHGADEHAMSPLLTGVWVQSRCTRCHTYSNVPGVAVFNRGLKLIDRAACFACHNLQQLPARERIAPNLDSIGEKVRPLWLKNWLLDPQAYLAETYMPNHGLDTTEAVALTAYLMSLSDLTEGQPADRGAGQVNAATLATGRRLVEKSACKDCHSNAASTGFEGIIAPDMSRIGSKVKRPWLAEWLRNPIHFQPATVMPSYGFTVQQANDVADYLINTFSSAEGPTSQEDAMFAAQLTSEDLIAEGQRLFRETGCFNCHALDGKKNLLKIGPDLSDVGNWGEHHLEWGTVEHEDEMGLRDFLSLKIDRPQDFGENMIMPTFNFDEKEIEAIVVALMSFSENPRMMQTLDNIGRSEALRLALPEGSVGRAFKRYQCLTCHSLNGQYGHMAPELSYEGDKVKKQWLVKYLETPHLIRPLSETRMPWLGMNREEIELIASYIDIAWKDDRIPDDPFDGVAPLEKLVKQGEEIYWSDYECSECHMIAGEEGEDGPALDGVGNRLKPGWIYQWLLDPQAIYDNDMPAEDITEEDARAMTAYLMSLK